MPSTYEFTCEWCQKEIILSGGRASIAKRDKQRFCSKSCANGWRNRSRTDRAREEKLRRLNEKLKPVVPGMAFIPLNVEKVATVDQSDYEMLSRYTWYAMLRNGKVYAASRTGSGRRRGPFFLMHRLIAGRVLGRKLRRGEAIHHVDGNPLNNRKNNLLICTIAYHNWLHRRLREAKEQSTQAIREAA